MAFSFLYLAVRALLGALVRSRRGLAILRRQVVRPKLGMADRALLAAAAVHLPRPQRAVLFVSPRTLFGVASGAGASEVAATFGPSRSAAAVAGDPGTRA